jgi:hypothetical protein
MYACACAHATDGRVGWPGAGVRAQLWRAVRTLAIAFLVISGVNTLIEDRGVPKGTASRTRTGTHTGTHPCNTDK